MACFGAPGTNREPRLYRPEAGPTKFVVQRRRAIATLVLNGPVAGPIRRAFQPETGPKPRGIVNQPNPKTQEAFLGAGRLAVTT